MASLKRVETNITSDSFYWPLHQRSDGCSADCAVGLALSFDPDCAPSSCCRQTTFTSPLGWSRLRKQAVSHHPPVPRICSLDGAGYQRLKFWHARSPKPIHIVQHAWRDTMHGSEIPVPALGTLPRQPPEWQYDCHSGSWQWQYWRRQRCKRMWTSSVGWGCRCGWPPCGLEEAAGLACVDGRAGSMPRRSG
eukprot:scaffold1057_cov459-Prasinococcus_capsulatus_cf.AAC.10